jgi:site-specific DNA recombinase
MKQHNEEIKYFVYCRKSSEQEDKQALSIESQKTELQAFISSESLEVVKILEESHSAKKRGERPIFNSMLQDIEKGKANGILLWNINRLSRNAGDTGIVIDLLDSGHLKEVRALGQIFRNTPNDKFLLGLFCSQAKLENDNKGVDSQRGLKKKAEMGVYPAPATLGYSNTPDKVKGFKIIIRDPVTFPLVRKVFDLMLTGEYTPPQILEVASREWGLRNKKGGEVARSTVYRILTDPFYYGEFEYPRESGNWYQGTHEPMITKEEYDRIQILLGRNGKPRRQEREFAYTGLIQCDECECYITAEERHKCQLNGNKHLYTYYHCTKKKKPRCQQRSVRVEELERQISAILGTICIPSEFKKWALDVLKEENCVQFADKKVIAEANQRIYNSCLRKLDTLVDMRANGEIDEDTFLRKKNAVMEEKERTMRQLEQADISLDDWIEKAEVLFGFAEIARFRFENGNIQDRRTILSTIGSNLRLRDQKLLVQLSEPLESLKKVSNELLDNKGRFEPPIFPSDKGKEALKDLSPVLGSGGRIRTCDLGINSPSLYR